MVKERVLFLFKRCTYADLNSTLAVLRGLVYQLVIQERSLLHILQKRYDEAGKSSVRGFECALYTPWHKGYSSHDECIRKSLLALDRQSTNLNEVLYA